MVQQRRIVAVNPAAHARGMRHGMGLAAALALDASFLWAEREPAREQAALDTLGLWALQYSSTVSLKPPHGLLVETGGSLRIFGGLHTLIADIARGLDALGFVATLASAPTPTGALMLARSGFAEHLDTTAALRAALPGLPVAALDSAAGFAATFDTLGLRTLADVRALPRDGLARRFGTHLCEELDRAFGQQPDPVMLLVAPTTFHTLIALPAPAESAEAILFACRRGLRQLEGFLRAGRKTVDRIDLHLHHERGAHRDQESAATLITLNFFEPAASAERFTLILRERLNHIALERRVERIGLGVPLLLEAAETTGSLLPDTSHAATRAGGGLRTLLERLHARLGQEAIQSLEVRADHRPARATALLSMRVDNLLPTQARRAPSRTKESLPTPTFGPRPVWLVEPARPLREVGGKPHHAGPLTLLAGPERIESGWWDDAPVTRDYFIARTEAHALVWIFRERREPLGWFLQGYFG